MTIKQYGGVFGRNPTFNNVTIDGELIINGSVFTGLDYEGAWNASTNTPTLTSSVGTLGQFYIVSVAGATDLNGITNWDVGDWALFNGSVWQRVEGGADGNFSTLSVSGLSSLNGGANVTGTVTADTYNIGALGSLGSVTTDRLFIATADGLGIQFDKDNNRIVPVGADGSTYNNNVSLGSSGLEFKNLALSGTVTATGIDVTGTVTTTGSVGIGTSTPASALELSGAATANARLTLSQTTAGLSSQIQQGSTGLAISAVGSQPILLNTNGAERMRIDASGNILFGKSSDSLSGAGIVVESSSIDYGRINLISELTSATSLAFYYDDGAASTQIGSISQSSTITSYNTSSDQRLKENIADADDAGSKIDAIQVRKFDWKANGSHQDYGMVAQELLEVAPEAVHQPQDPEEMMGVDYSKLVPVMLKEIQSLRARIAALES